MHVFQLCIPEPEASTNACLFRFSLNYFNNILHVSEYMFSTSLKNCKYFILFDAIKIEVS